MVSLPVIFNDAGCPMFTKSFVPSSFSTDGAHIVFNPSHPLTLFAGNVILFSVPLFAFEVKSVHALFVSRLSAKLLKPSIFVASKFNTRLLPLLELLDDEELELPELEDDELEAPDELLDELLLDDVEDVVVFPPELLDDDELELLDELLELEVDDTPQDTVVTTV